jgi:hypothetical protein
MKRISLEWLKGIPEDKRASFEEVLRNSSQALSRLYDMLSEREEELTRQESNIGDYDTPNWAVRQAHRNGERSQIRKLKDLLSFLKG